MLAAVRRHWFWGLLAAYLLYALAFVLRSSMIVDGRRYFLLLDDPMISMTYARNLAHGYGAVWYPGAEPVQGYSTPLWMLYMAMVHWLPLPPSMMSLPIQLTGIALIGGTMFCIKLLTETLASESPACRGSSDDAVSTAAAPPCLAPFLAVLLSGFYLPLNNWTLRGMEVGLLALGTSLAVWAALRCRSDRRWQWWLLPLLGALTTVRMDAVVVGAAVLIWLTWAVPERRWRTLIAGIAWLMLFVIGQMVIQRIYYHDWLPNTYYLKVAGVAFERRFLWGAYVLFHFLVGMGLWVLIPAAFYVVTARTKDVWLLPGVIAAQTGYSVYVGGDAWEHWGGANRYLSVVRPLFFVIVALGLVTLAAWVAKAVPAVESRKALAAFVVGLLILVRVNSYESGADKSLDQWLLWKPPPELAWNFEKIRQALWVRQVTSPRARVAVIWAGTIPYFSQRPTVDLLGKNDRIIARGPNRPYSPPPLEFFRSTTVPYCWPGHTKYNFRYAIGKLAPDVIIEFWPGMEAVQEILVRDYESLRFGKTFIFLKKNSAEVKRGAASTPS